MYDIRNILTSDHLKKAVYIRCDPSLDNPANRFGSATPLTSKRINIKKEALWGHSAPIFKLF